MLADVQAKQVIGELLNAVGLNASSPQRHPQGVGNLIGPDPRNEGVMLDPEIEHLVREAARLVVECPGLAGDRSMRTVVW